MGSSLDKKLPVMPTTYVLSLPLISNLFICLFSNLLSAVINNPVSFSRLFLIGFFNHSLFQCFVNIQVVFPIRRSGSPLKLVLALDSLLGFINLHLHPFVLGCCQLRSIVRVFMATSLTYYIG